MVKLTTMAFMGAVIIGCLIGAAEVPGGVASAQVFGLNCKGNKRCSSFPGGVCPSTLSNKGDGPFTIAAFWNPSGNKGVEVINQDGKLITGPGGAPLAFTSTFIPGATPGEFTAKWTSTYGTQTFYGVATSFSSGVAKKFRAVTTDQDKTSAACDGDGQ